MKPIIKHRPKIRCKKCGKRFRPSEWEVAEHNCELIAVPTKPSLDCDHQLYIANLEQICR
jgi:Zn finger protein HypA/HybF involved in hydrogenase expression